LKNYFRVASEGSVPSPLVSTEVQDELNSAILLVNQIWNHNYSTVEQQLDAEQAEAILYLANYFLQIQTNQTEDVILAEFFLSRLLSFTGPEGDEARMMLKELRSKQSFTMTSSNSNEGNITTGVDSPLRHTTNISKHLLNPTISPLFSPWNRLSTHDTPKKLLISPTPLTSNTSKYSQNSSNNSRISSGSRDGYGLAGLQGSISGSRNPRGRLSGSNLTRSNLDIFDRYTNSGDDSKMQNDHEDLIVEPIDVSSSRDYLSH